MHDAYIEKAYAIRRTIILPIEKPILEEIMSSPNITKDDLLSMSAIVKQIGPLDFSLFEQMIPGLDAASMIIPKQVLLEVLLTGMQQRGLIRILNDGTVELTPLGYHAIHGIDAWERGAEKYHEVPVRPEDNVLVLRPEPDTIHKLVLRTDAEDGAYIIEPLQYLGAHSTSAVVRDGELLVYVYFIPVALRLRADLPVVMLHKA